MRVKIFLHGKLFSKKSQNGTFSSSPWGELLLLIHCYLGVITFFLRLNVYFVEVLLKLVFFLVYILLFNASVTEILEKIVSQSMNDKKMNHFIWLRS